MASFPMGCDFESQEDAVAFARLMATDLGQSDIPDGTTIEVRDEFGDVVAARTTDTGRNRHSQIQVGQ